jgi:hypothetical protein
MRERTAALVSAFGLIVALTGCSVEGYTAHNAIRRCADHGGLVEIYHDAWDQHAKCINGVVIKSVNQRPVVDKGQ